MGVSRSGNTCSAASHTVGISSTCTRQGVRLQHVNIHDQCRPHGSAHDQANKSSKTVMNEYDRNMAHESTQISTKPSDIQINALLLIDL